MATYKVTNADAPIESDYWIDYPIKDPATNLDSVDEEGHILVERHVTRSVNLASYNSVLAKMPAVDANTTGLANLKTYAETNVQALNTALDGVNTSITSVTKTATDTATTVSNIQKKIDTIKGIDIDEFKLVTDTNIKTNAAAISTIKADIATNKADIVANNTNAVHITGDESISGVKTFTNTTEMNDVSVSGAIYKETSDGCLELKNGTDATGAYALLYGSDYASCPGYFSIGARTDSGTFVQLVGKPNGSLTWGGKELSTQEYVNTKIDVNLHPSITGSITLNGTTNNTVVLTNIVTELGLEVGDVIRIDTGAYNKLHTVESITNNGSIIVNYEHAGNRANGSLKLPNFTGQATVTRVAKWFNASIGLGQAWVNMLGSRVASTTYTNTTRKPILVNIASRMPTGDNAAAISLTVGGVPVARSVSRYSANEKASFVSAIVPAGATYVVSNLGGSLHIWAELR